MRSFCYYAFWASGFVLVTFFFCNIISMLRDILNELRCLNIKKEK